MPPAFGQMITKRITGVTIGQRFGRVVVLAFVRRQRSGFWKTFVECKCDCGESPTLCPSRLRSGITKSCGCYRREGAFSVTHGDARGGTITSEYNTYRAMLNRCYDTNNHAFHYYGGRGIGVCDRWRHSFVSFLEDMGRRPAKGLSLDRFPNRNGHYEPGNVRWATWRQQAQNKDATVLLTLNGNTLCQSEWSRILHIPVGTISRRIRSGWTTEEALTAKDRRYNSA